MYKRQLTVLAIILAVLVLVSVFIRSRRLLVITFVVYVASSLLLGAVFPNLVQKFAVEPSELSRESPYIAHNIQSTRAAFGLDKINVKSLDVNYDLTFEKLTEEHRDTIENIRLWDWRSLGQTYGQLQEIRAYYDFHDIDLDRYQVGDRTRQMALSARELSVDLLPAQAKTWVLSLIHIWGIYGKKSRLRIKTLAELLDFESILTRRVGELSRGMRQRLLLAIALLPDPCLLYTSGISGAGLWLRE